MYVSLCFGWIDSTYKKIDGKRLQRFTPRAANSKWGELNKERCRYLIKRDLMTEEGYNALPDLDGEFIIAEDILNKLKSDDEIWQNFSNFPELYKKIRIGNIERERKKTDVFERMLNNFLEKTKANKKYGNWDDYGRLSAKK
ncbi:YdeI family protein [uncultured Methanobrevibacter sp.]|uniref:YdeI/OmpD-associated family protein n=1 Tax=uncultured Methanobrevibacter sp. TaxID=253161 RepID=UPI00261BBA87|nr:YdeI/OmpD-associated family protein [uncultured Methanobrevibacter sp.]